MCGIAGLIQSARECGLGDASEWASQMSRCLLHRGPDDGGLWTDSSSQVALGHRRLSILDLSPSGHQPMLSNSGRYALVFNGEIYNFQELRSELHISNPGLLLRSTSDTAVALAAFEQWGIPASLCRFNGMFAIAVWDNLERRLTLACDRTGEKPIYYGLVQHRFVFASETKCFRALPFFNANIDRKALTIFLQYGFIPAPYCIYEGLHKIEPGTYVTIDADKPQSWNNLGHERYWSLADVIIQAKANPFSGTLEEATDELERLVTDSIRLRMISDVPIGTFLSGGIDSTCVTALMQRLSSRPVKTFTIGFRELECDEAPAAKAIARSLGTEHTELYVSARDALELIPRLPAIYDEPFADSSQIPTTLLSRITRRHVTVSLSGDGGDELFGGYTRYKYGAQIRRILKFLPPPSRALISRILSLSERGWTKSQFANRALARLWPGHLLGNKIGKLARVISTDNDDIYSMILSAWIEVSEVVIGSTSGVPAFTASKYLPAGLTFVEKMMFLDATHYLPGDIFVKLDRAAMNTSLETRVPFVDQRIIEFAWSLPQSMKISRRENKPVLRNLAYRHVPRSLLDRPKSGFGVPLASWLRGPLRTWALDMLAETRLRREGYLDSGIISKKLRDHLEGRANAEYALWNVLMFESWLDYNRRSGITIDEDHACTASVTST